MTHPIPRRHVPGQRKGRAQCIIHRNGRILLAYHVHAEDAYWVLPGGGIEAGESPEAAAIREISEECSVTAVLERELSRVTTAEGQTHYTYLADIGTQQPQLNGEDAGEKQVLQQLAWKSLHELAEREKLHLWTAGLLYVQEFYDQVRPRPILA